MSMSRVRYSTSTSGSARCSFVCTGHSRWPKWGTTIITPDATDSAHANQKPQHSSQERHAFGRRLEPTVKRRKQRLEPSIAPIAPRKASIGNGPNGSAYRWQHMDCRKNTAAQVLCPRLSGWAKWTMPRSATHTVMFVPVRIRTPPLMQSWRCRSGSRQSLLPRASGCRCASPRTSCACCTNLVWTATLALRAARWLIDELTNELTN